MAVADALGWERFDVVGTHTGSVEAVELARLVPERIGSVVIVSIPAYVPDEVLERRHGVAAARPALDAAGAVVRSLWTNRVRFRPAPVDTSHIRDLVLDELVSLPTVHWAYEAVIAYPMLERLADLRDLVVFAPRDDLWELTVRARPALHEEAAFLELPDLDFDLWEKAPERMAALLDSHVPA